MTTPSEIYSPGLEGVIAGETADLHRHRRAALSRLSRRRAGRELRPSTRSRICCCTASCRQRAQLAEFQQARSRRPRSCRRCSATCFKALPQGRRADGRRSAPAVSMLAHFDPDVERQQPRRRTCARPSGCWRRSRSPSPSSIGLSKGLQPVAAAAGPGLRGQLPVHAAAGTPPQRLDVKALRRVADPLRRARVQRLDVHRPRRRLDASPICTRRSPAAIGALKGPLHGGANEKVMDMLLAAGGPDNGRDRGSATPWPARSKVMGFGHRVYKTGDVRARHPQGIRRRRRPSARARRSGRTPPTPSRSVMAAEKNMFPNLDWPAGRLYHAMGLEMPLYTPIFVASRITGWSAHVIEQLEHNRLIRPRSRYTGPEEKHVKPIAERG